MALGIEIYLSLKHDAHINKIVGEAYSGMAFSLKVSPLTMFQS
jgi:hypothetical protein